MIKGGLGSITFREHTPEEVVGLVVKAGLAGIEWGGDIHVPHGDLEAAQKVRSLTEDAGLEVAAYGSYYRVGESEVEDLPFERVLATARALGAPLIRVWAGQKGSNDADLAYRIHVVEELKRVGAMAKEEGLGVSCEYHGGTLTDTNASAQELLEELANEEAENIDLYWQPPNGQPTEYCLEGLKTVLHRVTNLHVFYWQHENGQNIRRPLSEGEERWLQYLAAANRGRVDRFGLIEFVMDGSPEQFLEDATTLKEWLGRM